jgi:hypothetical protein
MLPGRLFHRVPCVCLLVAQGVPQGRRKKQAQGAAAAFFMPKTPDVTVTKIYTDKVYQGEQTAHAASLTNAAQPERHLRAWCLCLLSCMVFAPSCGGEIHAGM